MDRQCNFWERNFYAGSWTVLLVVSSHDLVSEIVGLAETSERGRREARVDFPEARIDLPRLLLEQAVAREIAVDEI